MATYTSNYQLHQWEASDSFLRTDFNTDFQKIDAAIGAVAALAAGKCRMACGSYTGDGTTNRVVALGFRPKLLIVGQPLGNLAMVYDGGPIPEHTSGNTLKLADQGFLVSYHTYSGSGLIYDTLPTVNRSGVVYVYAAFY